MIWAGKTFRWRQKPHYHVDKNDLLAWWVFTIGKRCLGNDGDHFYEEDKEGYNSGYDQNQNLDQDQNDQHDQDHHQQQEYDESGNYEDETEELDDDPNAVDDSYFQDHNDSPVNCYHTKWYDSLGRLH